MGNTHTHTHTMKMESKLKIVCEKKQWLIQTVEKNILSFIYPHRIEVVGCFFFFFLR